MKKIVILLIVIIPFVSCVTGPSEQEMNEDIINFELPMMPSEGESLVYIVRPQSVGMLISFKVYIDEKSEEYYVGETKGSEYIYFPITPGNHEILSKAENLAKLEMQIEPGKVYFLEQIPKMGILVARNNLQIIQDINGKYWVKNLKPGKMK